LLTVARKLLALPLPLLSGLLTALLSVLPSQLSGARFHLLP
jgi:hypothetical protein